MLDLELTLEHEQAIRAHAQRAFPHECCGFLLGRDEAATRRVAAIAAAENERTAAERHNRFSITPDVYLRAEREARRRRLDVIGFYHSHPDAPARPSDYDLEHAWPVYSYLIVSVRGGVSAALTSWVLREDRSGFEPQVVRAQDPFPPPHPEPPRCP